MPASGALLWIDTDANGTLRTMRDVVGIVLAAGESRRMGSPKALLLWRGHTFLEHVNGSLMTADVADIRVVVGPWGTGRQANSAHYILLENPHPEGGPISSIRIALTSKETKARFAVVSQVDHPAVRPETVRALVDLARSRPGEVVIPMYEGRGGHPVAIPSELFPVILDPKTASLRDAIASYPADRVHRWPCGDPGVLVNVDTPEDLDRLVGSGA